jgi:hypothetical protein
MESETYDAVIVGGGAAGLSDPGCRRMKRQNLSGATAMVGTGTEERRA